MKCKVYTLKCRVRSTHPPSLHFSNTPRSFFLHRRPLPLLPCLPCHRHLLSPSGLLSLPQTCSSHSPYHYNTSFLRSFFLHILSFSPKTPHGRTQAMPQPTPNRNPCHALHSPVSLPTGPWLSSPPLRYCNYYVHLCTV